MLRVFPKDTTSPYRIERLFNALQPFYYINYSSFVFFGLAVIYVFFGPASKAPKQLLSFL